jgi:hypothetical protein
MYGGIFYWTTGQSVVIEEYNEAQDSFYHNSYDVPKVHSPCSRLIILHPDLQPIPTPMAPPRIPQGVFSQTRARVVWRPPPQIAGLGMFLNFCTALELNFVRPLEFFLDS